MIKKILFLTLLLTPPLQAFNLPLMSAKNGESCKILINNRILAVVNGKPFSTYDLMKKMDLAFYRQYPQYVADPQARFHFYNMNWKALLEEMIDKELILADAEESKITVSGGDIRQEMEASFGPNIIANLDKAGISFEEAMKIMQEEILVKRLISGRVHAKALRLVTPAKVRIAYEAFAKDPANGRLTQWSYNIITIKERSLEKTQESAQVVHQMLLDGIPLDQLATAVKEKKFLGKKGDVTVSKTVKHNDKELSQDYLSILADLEPGKYSAPFPHRSRSNNITVYRILFIQEKIPGGVPPYKEMERQIKERLLDEEIDKETTVYLTKLRHHYHVRSSDLEAHLPPNYEPFSLR